MLIFKVICTTFSRAFTAVSVLEKLFVVINIIAAVNEVLFSSIAYLR